jgi:formylglycine-generating enzyme required for sulfatase activity
MAHSAKGKRGLTAAVLSPISAEVAAARTVGTAAPQAALGRADLLRLLVLWGKGGEQAAARLTGFVHQAPEPAPPEPLPDDAALPQPAAANVAPAQAARPRTEHYSATLSSVENSAQTAEMADYEKRQANIANAPILPEPPPSLPPPWQPLSPERRLVVLAEKHLRSLHSTNQWDVERLARQLALGGLPISIPNKRHARKQRLRWGGNAMVLFMRRQTEPLHEDYRALVRIVQRRSGGRVPVYSYYQGDGWAVYDPASGESGRALPRLWRNLAQTPRLAGMGGLAVGWPGIAPGGAQDWPRQWAPAGMLAATAAVAEAAVLPGSLSALPLACWDTNSRMQLRRRQPNSLMQVTEVQLSQLLALLTLAVVVHPPLLRALRCLAGLPACAEVAAWESADVACNNVAIAVRRARRAHYTAILQSELPLAMRNQAAVLIAAHHGRFSFEILLEESQLAALSAPGGVRLDHAAYFAGMAREMLEAGGVQHGAAANRPALAERMSYFARQGHRTSGEAWALAPGFTLAWALSNPSAVRDGVDLPAEFPLALLPGLREKILGVDAGALPVQGLRLRQVDGYGVFERCSVEEMQAGLGGGTNVLAQWACGDIVRLRSGQTDQAGAWLPAQTVESLVPLNLAQHMPLEISDGQTVCIVQHEPRPAWALEWGRDRTGLYAFMPNPFGEPVRIAYPRGREPVQISVPVPKRKAKAKGKAKQTATFSIQALTVGLDEIGPLATLIVEGANGLHSQTLRYIAPGRFLMGSPEAETAGLEDSAWFDRERPQHYVTISEGFWLADTACTQGFWQAVMGENPSRFNAENEGGLAHPVENVSWDMIQLFLPKLAALLSGCYATLPTEAEWEYACRAGSTTPFSFGETINPAQVNYDGNYPYGEGGEQGEYRERTVPVKELLGNEWGLYQMHGNVWEWCADKFGQYTADAVRDPGLAEALVPVPDKEAARVLRGGGWFYFAQDARSACRSHRQPDWLYDITGFRWAFRSKSQASGV